MRHAAEQPECVNGWRRLAEFRGAAADGGPHGTRDDPDQRSGRSAGDEGGVQRVEKMSPAELVGEWLRLDPVCRAGLDFLEVLVLAGQAGRRQLVESLAAALDYGPDPALQAAMVRNASAADHEALLADVELWADRRGWWPAVHGANWCRELWSERVRGVGEIR